jgi:hypothetical protein
MSFLKLQPRSDIFPIFDNIIVLTRGGRVAYSGPSRKVLKYFDTLGYRMPNHTNPSDFILDICSLDLRNNKSEIESKARVETMVENWRKTHLSLDSLDRLEAGQDTKDGKEVDPKHTPVRRRHAPFGVAFPVLLRRSYLNTRRQPVLVISRVMQVVSLGIIQALFYARQDYAQVSVQNRIGMIQQTLATMFIG